MVEHSEKGISRKGLCCIVLMTLQIEREMKGVFYSFTMFGRKLKLRHESAHFPHSL